jgi:glutamate 5-kinase
MVSLFNLQGWEIGRGVTDYAQGEILQIMGQKSSRIREILGYKYHEEVIHRDDMVIRSSTPNQDGENDD